MRINVANDPLELILQQLPFLSFLKIQHDD
jgi:hypothetical protein